MFTLSSTARKLELRIMELELKLAVEEASKEKLQKQWNALVSRINKLGGENFLQNARLSPSGPKQQFSNDDLRRLLQLCHPDKHGGSSLAVEMTAKLNKARS